VSGQARVLYPEGFQVYADGADTLALVKLVPDELTLSKPDDVAVYLREFDRLRSAALFDDQARTLLNASPKTCTEMVHKRRRYTRRI
jgi:hypothetical protein